MVWFRIVVLLLALSWPRWASLAEAASTPESERSSSYALSAAARARIEPLDARSLGDDATFVATLRAVLTDSALTNADRIDSFFLMLRKIGWDFTARDLLRLPGGAGRP